MIFFARLLRMRDTPRTKASRTGNIAQDWQTTQNFQTTEGA